MAPLELSYDRDWVRFRTSFFFASGDDNPNNGEATGFDTIFDNPNFAGGELQLLAAAADPPVRRQPRAARTAWCPTCARARSRGRRNFVNPGLLLVNFGVDFDLTPEAAS